MDVTTEIDKEYKQIAQKKQETSCEELFQRIAWIEQIAPDIRQREIKNLAAILVSELQRFEDWENIKSDLAVCEHFEEVIRMLATTEYVENETGNAYTECLRFLYHLSIKSEDDNVSEIVKQFWSFQDILPTIKGIFLLEKGEGIKIYPIYEMVIGMARTFKCDNDHLLNLAIALQLFEKINGYAIIEKYEEIQQAISEIVERYEIEFLEMLINNGELLFDEMDYKKNGTLIVKKNDQIIIRNIRREYFTEYFAEEEILSENQLAWYVKIQLEAEEELTDLKEIFCNCSQKNKVELLKRIEQDGLFNVFMPKRIVRNRTSLDIIRFLNPASVNDNVIVYHQKTEENGKDGFLKFLHSGEGGVRSCWLLKNEYDVLTVDFFATFYLEAVQNRWGFCTDLESGKECFYQEYLMKRYLQESLQNADENSAKKILDDIYNFILRYFDFNNIDENSLMDGKLLAYPFIDGFQTALIKYYSEENMRARIFNDAMEEWEYDIANFQGQKSWRIKERKVWETDFLNTGFEKMVGISEQIPKKDLYVFVNKKTGKIMINLEYMEVERKIKKLSQIVEKQVVTYAEKADYMCDNLSRLLQLVDANDLSHASSEMFQCEGEMRKNVYLYKALWHFQVFDMNRDRINKFWHLILDKHYLGMVEETEIIKSYFNDMENYAQEEGTLVIAKESSANDSTLYYLYEHFKRVHGERCYLSWAFDTSKIVNNLENRDDQILWRGKPLKKIVFMVDNLMKGGSLQKMLKFHFSESTDEREEWLKKRDYLNIVPTVKEMLDINPNLQIEVHPIFGYKQKVEEIQNDYPVQVIIHQEISDDYYSDKETVDIINEIYHEQTEKGICCAFRYNNLPAKTVFPKYVCEYKRCVGLFQRSPELSTDYNCM